MKQNTSGLHVGKYREPPTLKHSLAASILPAALIFLALAGLLISVTGLTAVLPLLAAGFAGLALCVLARQLRQENLLLLAALAALALLAVLGRDLLLNGFGALWNGLRDLWAAQRGLLLPLAGTDGSGLWLAAALLGLLLAALSLLLARVPLPASCLLIGLTIAAGFVQMTAWLPLAAAVSVLLLTLHRQSAVGLTACFTLSALCLLLALPVSRSALLQSALTQAQSLPHRWRYETAEDPLPEGQLSDSLPETSSETVLLSVTADRADTLYLRGFVGDTYENGTWSALDTETAAAEKDLFYWLHENGFYPQSQFAFAAQQTGGYETETIQIRNLSACSLYRYEPFSVLPASAGTARNRLTPSAVKTSGWNGEREYSYTVIADAGTILPQILDELQQNEADDAYLQMESAYRDFVDSYALAVPQEFTDELGSLLEETKQTLNLSGALTKEEAQLCALSFLETCFGGNTSLPLDSTAKGTTYQYATVAALALRYYGIPARYVEGFTVKTAENENSSVTAENAGAWVEVYQDGVGWLPLALTPGLESLAPEQTETGIRPVGAGEGEGNGPRITEGQEPEEEDADPSDESDDTPDGGQRTGLLRKPAFWLLLFAALLLLLAAALVIRRAVIVGKRRKTFEDPDNAEAVASLFADAAALLAALGIDRGTGSMDALRPTVQSRFGDGSAALYSDMAALNAKALFSSHKPDDSERNSMQKYHETVLNLVKTGTKFPKKLALRYLRCLY